MKVIDSNGNAKQILTVNTGMVFGSTTIPLGSTPPSSGQILEYNGTNIVGQNQQWKQLAQLVASNSATLDFTGLTGYTSYMFNLKNVIPVTNTVDFYMRVSANNGSSYDTGNNYYYSSTFSALTPSPTPGGFGAAGVAFFDLALNVTNGSTTGVNAFITFTSMGTSTLLAYYNDQLVFLQGSTVYQMFGGGTYVTSTGPVNAIRFLFSSGNISSGTITAYGLI